MNLPTKLGQSKTCVGCGTEFTTGRKHHSRSVYCSRDCWKKHWKGEATHMWGRTALNKGVPMLEETRRKVSDSKKGKNTGVMNWRWISDRSLLAKANEHRNDTSHREWANNVKNRDGRKCRIANADCEGRMEAHHILSYKNYPELRYEVNNGITLCHAHHPSKRVEEQRLSPFFLGLNGVMLRGEGQHASLVVALPSSGN